MIERKNVVARSAGSNTAEKAMNVANVMIKESIGPAKKLTDGLIMAFAKGATVGGAGGVFTGTSIPTAATVGTLNAGRQLLANADSQVAKAFVKILQEATLNPETAKELMRTARTGKVSLNLQSIVNRLKDERGMVGRDINADRPQIPKDISWAKVNQYLKQKGFDVRGVEDVKDLYMNRRHGGRMPDPEIFPEHAAALEYAKKSQSAKGPMPTGQRIESNTKRYFGLTTDPREAGYIFTDGTMLDMSGKRHGGSAGQRAYDHRQMNYAPKMDDYSGTEGMYQFMAETGGIRLNYSGGEVNVTVPQTMTRQQANMLRRLVDGKNPLYVDVVDSQGKTIKHYDYEVGKKFHIDAILDEISKTKK